MILITDEQRQRMLENARKEDTSGNKPVVKLFTPDAGATWLLSEIDPDEPDIAFGLCDLGHGCPELGYVSLSEIADLRGKLGLPVEQDLWFKPRHTLVEYADLAHARGAIVTS